MMRISDYLFSLSFSKVKLSACSWAFFLLHFTFSLYLSFWTLRELALILHREYKRNVFTCAERKARHFSQQCTEWSFSTVLPKGNYFLSPVQHSIRLHVRWLWLMAVILFCHNVAVLGNWRWVQQRDSHF